MAFGDLDFTLRGRRGTHGVGLALLARLGPVWRHCRPGCLRARRGAWRHLASEAFGNIDGRFCARHGLGDVDLRLAGQAWHLVTSTVTLVYFA